MKEGEMPDYDDPAQICPGMIVINVEKCVGCGTCTYPCPSGAIHMPPKTEGKKRGIPIVDELAPGVIPCLACGDCVAACPRGAITIKKGFQVAHPYFYERLTQDEKFTYPQKY